MLILQLAPQVNNLKMTLSSSTQKFMINVGLQASSTLLLGLYVPHAGIELFNFKYMYLEASICLR